MQTLQSKYDVAIIGGGLAGLSLSIQLARKGYSIILFEKEKYPFHKVCGEYISMESWHFLQELGMPLTSLNVPLIHTLQLTSPNGKSFITRLPLGGFGISRYLLDSTLASIAKAGGVTILEETKVTDTHFNNHIFEIDFNSKTNNAQKIQAPLCCGSFGKRSNLDVKWKRPFIQQKQSRINNYVGVKYHVQTDWPQDMIGLHNFSGGYCGISKIEGGHYCLCYMTTAAQLKKANNSIMQLQEKVLCKNPFLKKIFSDSNVSNGFPVTISQISFDKKSQVEQHLLMLGDAAGMITPLCGNGMSMALHSSKIAAQLINEFLQSKLTYEELANKYEQRWKASFSQRLQTGRVLQSFFGANTISNLFVQTFKTFPFLANTIIKKTHGTSF